MIMGIPPSLYRIHFNFCRFPLLMILAFLLPYNGKFWRRKIFANFAICVNRKIFICEICTLALPFSHHLARKMALYRYFKPAGKPESLFLPNSTSPLPSVVPSSTIEAVNRSVENVLDDGAQGNSQNIFREILCILQKICNAIISHYTVFLRFATQMQTHCPSGLNFCEVKLSRMAADLRKPQKLNPTEVKVYIR